VFESVRRTSRPVSNKVFHRWVRSWVRPVGRQEEHRQKYVSQYIIRQPSRHIPYPGYRCECQSAPLLLLFLPLLHTSATTCLSRLSSQPREAYQTAKTLPSRGEAQCGLVSVKKSSTLRCASIVIFEVTRRKYGNTVQSEEDS
jgi:hypothetical protein